jgi:hypothetical protein
MVKDRIPALATLTVDEKWQLMAELEDEVMAGDPTEQEPFKSEIVHLLETRYQHYLSHPETASSWEDVSKRMRTLK